MQLDWKARYRIKAVLSAVSFVATFTLLALLQVRAGIYFVPLSVLPGMLTSIFLWPEVLAPAPLPPNRIGLFRVLSVLMYAAIWAGCFVIDLASR